ncbi:MAG: HD domain-containing phosphohydrolase [Anaerosomatales bacterium]|nr:HD domain-containing phosphohydrolase [Anaerosomatales bacterium]
MNDARVDSVIRRERQLHALSYVVILALTGMAGVLASAILKGLGVGSSIWLIDNYYFRVLFPGLLVGVVLYMIDQHRRLQTQLNTAHEELANAKSDLEATVARLAFAYDVAQAIASLTAGNATRKTLEMALDRFGADAAAIVADDVLMVPDDDSIPQTATARIMSSAVEAVRSGEPMSSGDAASGYVLAIPLRIGGKLQSVIALWKDDAPFSEEDARTLALVSRVLELGLENRALFEQANERLRGLVSTLATLVAERVPEYRAHAQSVSDLAVNVGLVLGLPRDEVAALRAAAQLLDVGMLEVPADIVAAPRALTPSERDVVQSHTIAGERLVREAGFSGEVCAAVRSHHERLDGSGYPDGLRGEAIPLLARILGACDTYVALTSPRPHRPAMRPADAMSALLSEAGARFDARVVAALRQVLGMAQAGVAPEGPAEDASLLRAI